MQKVAARKLHDELKECSKLGLIPPLRGGRPPNEVRRSGGVKRKAREIVAFPTRYNRE